MLNLFEQVLLEAEGDEASDPPELSADNSPPDIAEDVPDITYDQTDDNPPDIVDGEFEDINLDIIPIKVLQDVDRRIADWRAAGGKDSDAYIQNQLRYLKRVELMANNATDTLTYF